MYCTHASKSKHKYCCYASYETKAEESLLGKINPEIDDDDSFLKLVPKE